MAGSHAHGHSCHHAGGMSAGRLQLSLAFTFSFVILEGIAGLRAQSLALVSDAGHNFTDGLALLLSWYALHLARKPATPAKTYGYHRAGILAALFNSLLLLGISALIFIEAYHLFLNPQPVASLTMMGVASIAVVLNTGIALGLRREAKHSVNLRSAYIHMAGDALSALGVIGAGLVIHFTHWAYADPLAALLIGVFIAYSSWSVLSESINILLEGTPSGLDMSTMVQEIERVPGVADVHDLHVWTIADDMNALSCHLHVLETDLPRAGAVLAEVKSLLAARYGVSHSTIETECLDCPSKRLYCALDTHEEQGEVCGAQGNMSAR